MAKNVSKRNNMSAQNRPFSLKATKKTQKVNDYIFSSNS